MIDHVATYGGWFVALIAGSWSMYRQVLDYRHRAIVSATEAIRQIFADPDVACLFYEIDYSRPSPFRGDADFRRERTIDRLFQALTSVSLIEYYIVAVYRSEETRKYLSHVEDVSRLRGVSKSPYAAFVELGGQLCSRSSVPEGGQRPKAA